MKERVTMEREFVILRSADSASTIAREFEIKPGTASNTFEVPLKWVCKLQAEEYHVSDWKPQEPASGVLVGPRHVLTAAHALDPYYKNPRHQWRIIVRPAFDGSQDLGEVISNDVRVSKGWRAGTKDVTDPGAYDYGMIILPNDITTKPRKELNNKPLGYWGHTSPDYKTIFAPLRAELLESKSIFCAGYPRGVKRAMWVGTGTLSHILFRTGTRIVRRKRGMNHEAMASLGEDAHGMSGGPVWFTDNSIPCLVGINNAISRLTVIDVRTNAETKKWQGHAARVTIEFFDEVSEWIRSSP